MTPPLREVKPPGISKAEENIIRESLIRDVNFELGLSWTGKERGEMHSKQRTIKRMAQRKKHVFTEQHTVPFRKF